MEEGIELDTLVAEKVMGLSVPWDENTPCSYCGSTIRYCGSRSWCSDCHEWRCSPYKEYSTDIAAAWEVVGHVLATWDNPRFWRQFSLDGDPDDTEAGWEAAFGWRIDDPSGVEYPFACVSAMTAPLAICLTALKTKGIDIDALDDSAR